MVLLDLCTSDGWLECRITGVWVALVIDTGEFHDLEADDRWQMAEGRRQIFRLLN